MTVIPEAARSRAPQPHRVGGRGRDRDPHLEKTRIRAALDVMWPKDTPRPVRNHHQTDVFGLQILGSLARVDDSWIWQS